MRRARGNDGVKDAPVSEEVAGIQNVPPRNQGQKPIRFFIVQPQLMMQAPEIVRRRSPSLSKQGQSSHMKSLLDPTATFDIRLLLNCVTLLVNQGCHNEIPQTGGEKRGP